MHHASVTFNDFEFPHQKTDGAYVFGVLLQGRDVFKHITGTLHDARESTNYTPRERVVVKSCTVRDTNLPGRTERMNPDALKGAAHGGPDLSKVRAALAKDKA